MGWLWADYGLAMGWLWAINLNRRLLKCFHQMNPSEVSKMLLRARMYMHHQAWTEIFLYLSLENETFKTLNGLTRAKVHELGVLKHKHQLGFCAAVRYVEPDNAYLHLSLSVAYRLVGLAYYAERTIVDAIDHKQKQGHTHFANELIDELRLFYSWRESRVSARGGRDVLTARANYMIASNVLENEARPFAQFVHIVH
jgi:hypothetical protein